MKTVTITSGKGGVGKSNVASNLSLALAEQGKRVLLMDADMGLANIDILMGIQPTASLADVVDGSKDLKDIMQEVWHGLKVIPAGSGVLKLERLTHAQRTRLAMGLQQLSSDFDLLIVDTGSGLTDNVLFFNSAADEVLLVTTPEPTALTDAYAIVKVLITERDVRNIVVLMNQVLNASQGAEVFKKLDGVCKRFLQHNLTFAGSVPKDVGLTECVAKREPIIIGRPGAPFSQAIHKLAERFDTLFRAQPNRYVENFWTRMVTGQ